MSYYISILQARILRLSEGKSLAQVTLIIISGEGLELSLTLELMTSSLYYYIIYTFVGLLSHFVITVQSWLPKISFTFPSLQSSSPPGF